MTVSVDRLVRKEVALGVVREIPPPQQHIGTALIAPWREVASDDVIFDYAKGLTAGLAPATSEDSESELAQKDDLIYTQGRAAVIDWRLKDHYTASDVTRYRELLRMQELVQGGNVPLTITRPLEDWNSKVARDTARRRRMLDNRLEWLIINQALQNGTIVYNDGKIKFSVDYGRPSGQHNQAPHNGLWNVANTADPIDDLLRVQDFMYDTYGVRMNRAIASRKAIRTLSTSDKFVARSGIALPSGGSGGSPSSGRVDPRYLIDGWGPESAKAVVEAQTGIEFIEYDAVYRTRAVGGQSITNNRFLAEDKVILLPDPADMDEVSGDLDIGFAATLTSPHPMGNWAPGYYEWERETTDPWGYDVGTGVKAFPVFPLMEYTYVLDVL